MSLSNVQADASCDKCGAGLRFCAATLPGIRVKMRANGWHIRGSKDFCPSCPPKPATPATGCQVCGSQAHTTSNCDRG